MPSVRFTAFAAPAMMKNTSTYQPQPSGIEPSTIGTKTSWLSCWWCAARPTAAADREQEQHLPAAVQAERAAVAELDPVVEEADRAARERRAEDRERRHRVARSSRGTRSTRRARSGARPSSASPASPSGAAGPPRGSCWPNSFRRRKSMNAGPARIEMISATSAATRTRAISDVSFAATASSPTAREPFTSTTSPGRSIAASASAASSAVASQRAETPFAASTYPCASGPTAISSATPRSATASPTSRWYAGASGPSSAISPSTAIRRRGPGPLGEVLERGAHRERVRVVAVVQEQHAVGELELLLAKRRELDLEPPVGDGHAERVAHRQRRERVPELVPRREARRRAGSCARRRRTCRTASTSPKRRTSRSRRAEVRLEQRLAVWNDRDPARAATPRSARPSPARRSRRSRRARDARARCS